MNTININYTYCKGCGICIEFCREKILSKGKAVNCGTSGLC